MSRNALRLARFPAFLTLALAAALVVLPGRAEVVLRLYLLALAGFALGTLLLRLRAALPERGVSPVDAALGRRPPARQRIPELERLEREVTLGQATAFDLHFRLRPTLRRIASELRKSDSTTSAPIPRQIWRNGASLTPAMGARMSGTRGLVR